MYEIGEVIVYGSTGICVIDGITTMDMPGIPKERYYYMMHPYQQEGNKIFAAIDNPKVKLRPVLTKNEAMELIDEIPSIEILWINNEKQREQQYKDCVRSGECKQWIRIIKTLYLRKQERIAQGKKITATDERYLKQAENYLYSELALALKMKKEEMEKYITDRINRIAE